MVYSVTMVTTSSRDNDISEMGIPQTYVVERDRFGKLVHRELKPNGQNEIVTNENKAEYVRYVFEEGREGRERSTVTNSSSPSAGCMCSFGSEMALRGSS